MLWNTWAVYLHSEAHQLCFAFISVNFRNCTQGGFFSVQSTFKSLLCIVFPYPLAWLHAFRIYFFFGGRVHIGRPLWISANPVPWNCCSASYSHSEINTILVLFKWEIINVTYQSYFFHQKTFNKVPSIIF